LTVSSQPRALSTDHAPGADFSHSPATCRVVMLIRFQKLIIAKLIIAMFSTGTASSGSS
jgi:hypothetical protein